MMVMVMVIFQRIDITKYPNGDGDGDDDDDDDDEATQTERKPTRYDDNYMGSDHVSHCVDRPEYSNVVS